MAQPRVVILSSRSLFAEGVAARLRRSLAQDELLTIDARQDDALGQVVAARPVAVVLDATDPDVTRHCPLGALLTALPSLKIIRLDPEQDQIQVVTSEQREAGHMQDLIEVIQSAESR